MSYKKKCTIREFVYECGSKRKNKEQFFNRVKRAGNTTNFVEKELKENRNGIQDLKRDRTCFAFENVFYDPVGSHKFGDPNTLKVRDEETKQLKYADKMYAYGTKLPNKIAARKIDFPLRDMDPIGPDFYGPNHKGEAFDEDMKLIPCLPKGMSEPTAEWLQQQNLQKTPEYWILWDPTLCGGKGGWKRNIKSWMDIHTPIFEKLLIDQKLPRGVRKIVKVLCGRLAFWLGIPNGGDNWQVTPLFYGTAGTGKSTIIRYVCQMYNKEDIFDMESTGEEVFLLWRAVDPVLKFVWRNLEVKAGLRLSSDRYQLMTDGVNMNIPRKGGAPWMGDFIAPGAQAGNDRLPYKDVQGSVSRRTPTLEFPEVVKQDTTLLDSTGPELPDLIRALVMGYLFFREWVGKRKFFDCIPDYFKTTTLNLQKNVNEVIKYYSEQRRWVKNMGKDPNGNFYEIPLDDFWKQMKMETNNNRVTEDQITSSLREQTIGLEIINYDKLNDTSNVREITEVEWNARSDNVANPVYETLTRTLSNAEVSVFDTGNAKKGIWIRGLTVNPDFGQNGEGDGNGGGGGGGYQHHNNNNNNNHGGGHNYHNNNNHHNNNHHNNNHHNNNHANAPPHSARSNGGGGGGTGMFNKEDMVTSLAKNGIPDDDLAAFVSDM